MAGRKKKGIKIEHNKNLFILIIILIAVLFFLVYFIKIIQNQTSSESIECSSDDDCILQQTTCCPCSMGGQSACMNRQNATFYQNAMSECPSDIVCAAVYNCQFQGCECQNGRCVEK